MTPPLDGFAPVSLAELDAVASLRTRTDAKHALDAAGFAALLDALRPTHRVLEIDGRRVFAYDSVYFDTADRLTLRAHVQGRRRRFKCRTRRYTDAGTCVFEVKRKDAAGATVKTRIAHPPAEHGRLTPAALAFLHGEVGAVPPLGPALRTTYRRITLLGPEGRLTADLDLRLGAVAVRPGVVVVESKSRTGRTVADDALRRLGSRPVPLSKYVLGVGLNDLPRPTPDTRRLARRLFAHA